MKVLARKLVPGGYGSVTLLLTAPDDVWHLYHIISKGDTIIAQTIRNITTTKVSGATEKKSVHMKMTLLVKKVEVELNSSHLRIAGENIKENPHVKLGAFHTVQLQNKSKFTLIKEVWDISTLSRMDIARSIKQNSGKVVLVIQQDLAHLCLITDSLTVTKGKFQMKASGKHRNSSSDRSKLMEGFLMEIYTTIKREIDFELIDAFIIAGPGFYKDKMYDFFIQIAEKDCPELLEHRSKILRANCSSGHKSAINEVLNDKYLSKQLKDVRCKIDSSYLDKFNEILSNDPDRAFYGIDHVEKVVESRCTSTVLVNDDLVMSTDLPTRERVSKIIQNAKSFGTSVHVLSVMHGSGEKLKIFTGIAAITKYQFPELNELPKNAKTELENHVEKILTTFSAT